MSYNIEKVEGIGEKMAEKLAKAGIKTTEDLLTAASTPSARKKLAQDSGIEPKRILTFANRADLMRISGVSSQFAELLNGAGVDTVKELRQRKPANLAERMKTVNEEKNLCKVTPSETQVQKWVDQAKELDAVLTY